MRRPACRAARTTASARTRAIVVGRAVGLVMHVVELAHRANPGARELAERNEADRVDRLRRERRGERVHRAAPRPEVVDVWGGRALRSARAARAETRASAPSPAREGAAFRRGRAASIARPPSLAHRRARSLGSRRSTPASGGTRRRAGRGSRRRARRPARSCRRRARATAARPRGARRRRRRAAGRAPIPMPKSLSLTVTRHESSSSAFSQRLRSSSRAPPSLSIACPLGPAVRLSTTPKSVIVPLRHCVGLTLHHDRIVLARACRRGGLVVELDVPRRVPVGARPVTGDRSPRAASATTLELRLLIAGTKHHQTCVTWQGVCESTARSAISSGHERKERERDLSARVDRRPAFADPPRPARWTSRRAAQVELALVRSRDARLGPCRRPSRR